jgi:protoporphyrin/coproporphyrin ferrochelatase
MMDEPSQAQPPYDSVLIVSFGGPEKHEDVLPFLEIVLRGKNVPRERLLEVAEHYYHFDGRSPINEHNRAMLALLEKELAAKGPRLPVYWGNRNWHPFLVDTLRRMAADGARRALAFVTSAYGSFSSCRQYLDDIARAREEVGEGAPAVEKIRSYYNHPGFLDPMAEHVREALERFPAGSREGVEIVYTAHSIPSSMAAQSKYVAQLEEAARLVSERVGRPEARLVFQSRSGPPSQPWLGPDICDYLRQLAASGRTRDVVVVPIGFLSDHIEVLFDLDTQAQEVAAAAGLQMVRAATVGVHARFIAMIRELIVERVNGASDRPALGVLGAEPDFCAADCCPRPQRPVR